MIHPELQTLGDYIRWTASELTRKAVFLGHGSDSYWDESVFLVTGILKLDWNLDPWVMHTKLTQLEKQTLSQAISRRIIDRVPTPYILGEAWFNGLKFIVNENTLIPRSPISELISQQFQPWLSSEPERILDMCTGSGCIGIATAIEFPMSKVDLVDISEQALEVAQKNIEAFELGHRVNAIKSDLFASLDRSNRYQLILSNPPYVDAEDFSDMPKEYHHEPTLGLVSGADGLDACRTILKEAANFLTDDGVLIVEVGNSAGALEEAYPNVAFTWLEFEMGGHGVFMLQCEQLRANEW